MLILANRERRSITDEDIMQETHEEPPKEVLLVDDSPGDIRLMREALRVEGWPAVVLGPRLRFRGLFLGR